MVNRNLPTLATPSQPAIAVLQPAIPQAYAHPGMSVAQVLAILRANWKIGAALGLFVFLAFSVMVILKPKAYGATATLQVNYEINDPLGGKEFPVALIGGYIATQMELLSGPVVLDVVVDKLKLYDNKHFVANMKLPEDARRTAAEKTLEKYIAVDQGKYGSQLIFVRYTASEPGEAAEIANAVADVYTSRAYQTPALQQNAEAAQRYNEQLKELKQKVDVAQNDLADFHKRTGLIVGDGGDVEMAALSNLESQLQDARNKRRQAEAVATTKRASAEMQGSVAVQNLRAQLRLYETRMQEYRATDGPKNPRVVELQAQIDATKKAIDEETRIDLGDSDAQLQSARALEAKLQRASDEQRGRVIVERQLKEEREKYKTNLELAQTAYRRALDSYEQITRDSSSKYQGINLISRATPPTQATGSRTRVGLVVALVAGLMFGLASAFAWGLVDRRVRCRDDIEREYGIPVIAEFGAVTG